MLPPGTQIEENGITVRSSSMWRLFVKRDIKGDNPKKGGLIMDNLASHVEVNLILTEF